MTITCIFQRQPVLKRNRAAAACVLNMSHISASISWRQQHLKLVCRSIAVKSNKGIPISASCSSFFRMTRYKVSRKLLYLTLLLSGMFETQSASMGGFKVHHFWGTQTSASAPSFWKCINADTPHIDWLRVKEPSPTAKQSQLLLSLPLCRTARALLLWLSRDRNSFSCAVFWLDTFFGARPRVHMIGQGLSGACTWLGYPSLTCGVLATWT